MGTAAAAPPLDDDNLLSEILVRLPPQPSSLPRASAVCKRWRSLVTDRAFIRRFRLRHRRNPPLLGYFHKDSGSLRFEPTMEPPNGVPPDCFSSPIDDGDGFMLLGCRHGLVLFLLMSRDQFLVWDPVTGDQHSVATPPGFTPGIYIVQLLVSTLSSSSRCSSVNLSKTTFSSVVHSKLSMLESLKRYCEGQK